MEHILLVLFICKIIDVFPLWPRCMWLVLYSWLCFRCGVLEVGVLFSVCVPLCCNFCVYAGFQSRVRVNSVKYFKSLAPFYWPLCLFWCVSFIGFLDVLTVFEVFMGVHCLALITGPLPVPFCWCPSPCPGGCLCTTMVAMRNKKKKNPSIQFSPNLSSVSFVFCYYSRTHFIWRNTYRA